VNRNITQTAAFAIAASTLAVFAIPARADVYLDIFNGRIRTGDISEDGTTITPNVRVFNVNFGEVAPNFTDEPGLQAPAGNLPGSSTITFTMGRALHKWTGADFSTIPAETLTMAFGPASRTTPPTDTPVVGFPLLTNADGSFHDHFDNTLNAPASDGIYLLELSLASNAPGVGPSLPYWVLFNQNDTAANVDAATTWVQNNLVPAPAGMTTAMLGFSMLLRRRRAAPGR
jgi:uncharacterized protein (TIGR03382 family)